MLPRRVHLALRGPKASLSNWELDRVLHAPRSIGDSWTGDIWTGMFGLGISGPTEFSERDPTFGLCRNQKHERDTLFAITEVGEGKQLVF